MANTLQFLISILPCAICAGGAVYMAINGMSGWTWGWFLFGAVLLFPTFRTGRVAELYAEKDLEESRAKLSQAKP